MYNFQHAPVIADESEKIVALTFKSRSFSDLEVSAIIDEDPLKEDSTMEDVMKEYDVESTLLINRIDRCKFLIKKRSGTYLTFNCDRFVKMTVKKVISIRNIDEDYIIEVKEDISNF